MSKIFDRVFHIVFFICFLTVTCIAVISICVKDIVGFFLGIALICASVFVVCKLRKKSPDIDNKRTNIIFAVMAVIMFIIQLVVALNCLAVPTSDWEIINEIAKSYAYNGNMEHIYDTLPKFHNYLARYPNNNGIAVLFSLYYRVIYLISGNIPIEAGVILNTIFINAAVVFCFLTAKKAFGNFHALTVAAICFLFLPYYTYCPYFYTDSVSMPFCVLSIYLFICAYESEKMPEKITLFFFSGAACAVGCMLKGSIVIVLIAVVMYMIYKGGIKKVLIGTGTVAAGFLVLTIAFNGLVSSLNIADKETSAREKYPVTHWIMMGLKGNGGYNRADSYLTAHAGSYQEKIQANVDVINKRISDYGFIGLMGHLGEKIEFTWSDGTYYISHYVYKNINDNSLLNTITPKGGVSAPPFSAFSSAMHVLILVMVCVSIFSCIRKPRFNYITLMHIMMFGVFLFFLIWETRSRYIFNFTPVFIIICADGIIRLADRLREPHPFLNKLKGSFKGKRQKLTGNS